MSPLGDCGWQAPPRGTLSQSPPPRRGDGTLGPQARLGPSADLSLSAVGSRGVPRAGLAARGRRKARGLVNVLGPRAQVARRKTSDVGTRVLTADVVRGAHPQGAEVLGQDFRWLPPRRLFTSFQRTLNCIRQVCSFFGRRRNLLEKLQRI